METQYRSQAQFAGQSDSAMMERLSEFQLFPILTPPQQIFRDIPFFSKQSSETETDTLNFKIYEHECQWVWDDTHRPFFQSLAQSHFRGAIPSFLVGENPLLDVENDYDKITDARLRQEKEVDLWIKEMEVKQHTKSQCTASSLTPKLIVHSTKRLTGLKGKNRKNKLANKKQSRLRRHVFKVIE